MVTVNAQFGGREVLVADLAVGLRGRGMDVRVTGPEGACRQAFEGRGVPVVGGGLDRLMTRPGAWLALARTLSRERPQVLHAFESEVVVPCRVIGALARVPARVSTMLTPYALRLEGRGRAGRLGMAAVAMAERLTQGLDHEVLAISHAVAADYRARGLRARGVLHTTPARDPAPVDLARRFGVPAGRAVLVCVGRLVDRKGIPDLIDCTARLVARGHPVHLLHIGDDPSGGANRARYLADAEARGVRDHVTLHGRWDGDVAGVLAAAAVVVQPSYSEGLGLVLVEAAMVGRPVVAYGVGGTVDVVEPGRTGWLAAAGDRQALAEAMEQALGLQPEARARLAARARERYRRVFSMDAVLETHELCYQDALASTGGA